MHIGIGLWWRSGSNEPPTPAAPVISSAWITPELAEVGVVFTANVIATGYPTPIIYVYDWKIDGVSTGETSKSIVSDTVTDTLTVTITASNSEGTSAPVTTAAVEVTFPVGADYSLSSDMEWTYDGSYGLDANINWVDSPPYTLNENMEWEDA